MNLEAVTLYPLRMPLVSPFETSFGRATDRECVLIEVRAEGLTGYGECVADSHPGYSYETVGTAIHILRDYLIPPLLGKPVPTPRTYFALSSPVRGHHMAKAALEMAFWDLQGQAEGKSLKKLFGGVRDRVEVGVSVGLQASPAALVNTVAGYLDQGYTRVKIKIKPGRDVEDARAVRSAFPHLRLQVDANSAFTLADAPTLQPLDDLDLLLIEQPLFEDDIWDHAKLQGYFKTPICLDESIITPRHARYALEMNACRIINIKPARVGGLANALEIHDLCQSWDIPVWCGGMLETGVGRAANLALASLPNFTLPGDISATERYYHEDITFERFALNPDSTITVPDQPGLGVTVNRAALAKYAVGKIEV
ncbi:MAG: o-succinylbenzoate synthase [Anaerolineales bacterium]